MNRKCKWLTKISSFLDNELDARTANTLRHHISNCPQCQAETRSLMILKKRLMNYYEEALPEHIIQKILAQASSLELTQRRFTLDALPRWAIAACAALAFSLGIILSSMVFRTYNTNYYELGSTSFYSYFAGDENVH
ncbi:MAG: zf-HC2 domain-containing protein [Candidatus Cloacimonetes bacterium]|nr:zf-HC2 domain-containing protein [Candidatus Cloacimonadota bacterium]